MPQFDGSQWNAAAQDPAASACGEAALRGIRVLDIATFVAAPFCGTILGDFGAEVIKIELPQVGDPLRKFGSPTECGDTLLWLSEARNKRAATLDLRKPEGAELFRRLVAVSDVVLENFRPGTLEAWGLGFEDLIAINPNLIMLRVSAYGQTGPKRDEPGFARIAHAFGGLAYLAGEADGPPVVPGSTSLADYLAGMWGAIGVMVALRARDQIGAGQYIDVSLYESVFRLLDDLAPTYARSGVVRERMGADTVNAVPHSHYRTQSGQWVAIACTSDRMFQRLAVAMGTPELARSPDYATTQARLERRDELNALVTKWVGKQSLEDVLAECVRHGVPCGQLYSIADIFTDPHYAARRNLMKVYDERIGEIVLPSSVPVLSKTPATFQHTGHALGADNPYIYHDILGMTPDDIAKLVQDRVI
jgi:crotonobetainyl-CoA:carnitine CoA-transferase CaiB-like acyl-CoA transferase